MSSPVAKRRRNVRIQDSEDEISGQDPVDLAITDKENVTSPPKQPSSPTERRSSLAPLDQNVKLDAVKLEPPPSLKPPESPRVKSSFNGPDIIQLSPMKSAKAVQEKPKEPTTRLVIDKLVLENFKSYAGTQVIGPFHSSFSAVVGPNGSGKSNVIDSMLFVFGFRANKMRQGKLSELIHNSESAPNLQSCRVDIHFQHVTDNLDDTTTVVEGSELIVSRKAFRNNSSKYYISGKESNYSEVTSLLKAKGIDLDHKRFLILQGEVESIAQMKPKAEKENDDGLLEYLEDIIGTSNYKSTIEDSFTKIEELNEICQEKESRFSLVEKEKNTLEGKKDEALDFLEKEKQLIESKSTLYQVNIYKAKLSIEANSKILEDLKDKLKVEKQQTAGFQEETKSLEKEYNDTINTIRQQNDTIKKFQDLQKKGEREKITVEEKKKSFDSKRKKSEKLLNIAKNALNESESRYAILTDENESVLKESEEMKRALSEEKAILDTIRAELTDSTKEFSQEIEVYEKKLQPWSERLEQKQSEITIAESQVQMLNEKRSNLDAEIESLKARIQEITDEKESGNQNISLLKEEYVHNQEQIRLGEQECQHASAKLAEMNNVLSDQRQKALEARGSLSTKENKSKVLSGLMRLQDTGRIQGFHGRLGDLGTIDDKYDVAISTACGQLDDMVVDTVEAGQQCIEYLRKNNLGYARFILLNKLRNYNVNPINTPRDVPRLFDLVKPKDPKFSNAFYSVLQDTLVATNMKEANQVAYGSKRFRVVTLDGKLIDKSGTLSGGGNVVNRGGMKSSLSSTVSERDVQLLEKELSQKEANYELAQNTYYEMNTALKELKDRQPEIDTQLSKLNFEIESLDNESKNSQARLKELLNTSRQLNADNKDLQVAKERVSSLRNQFENLQSESQEIQNKISELQEKIMQVGGVKLRLQKSKVDGIDQKIEILAGRIDNNKVSIKKLQNEIKRFSKSKLDKESEIENIDIELKNVEQSYQEKTKTQDKLESELNDLVNIQEDSSVKAETLKESLDEKLQKINELRSAEIEIENKVEKYQALVKQGKRHLEEYTSTLEHLELNDNSKLLDFLESEELSKYTNPNLDELSPDEIQSLDIEELESSVEKLERFISATKVDVDILEEYGKRAVEYKTRKVDLNEAVEKRDQIKKYSEELKKKRLDEFMEGFNTISATLKEMYQMITMGGNAELELVDSLDPFSEGILFSVMPPKKSWKNISNLSGGEKTLSSLALVFALHRYKPTPLYVMDEIDAALDFRNVSIVANYIKERTKNGQFIVISLRNNMFELAQQLVGIYKVNNMTRSITLQNQDMISRE